MALALYVCTAAALLWVWRRLVPLSRAAALALLLLPLVFTGRALLTNRVYAPIDLPFQYEPLASAFGASKPHEIALSDLAIQIIPWQKAVRHALSLGEWPLWNPFILCGDILAGIAQPAVYDPLNLLALLIPLPDAVTFGATMTFFLAALFTFSFARALGCSETASLVAAAGYAFCGMMAFYVGWPLARSWAFLPLVLFAVHLLVRERRMLLLIVALTLTIFAGHPESVLHVVTIGVAYGVFETVRSRRWTAIPRAIACGIVALGLTAIYLLPFAEAAPQSMHHLVRDQFYAPTPYGKLVSSEARMQRIERTFVSFARDQDPLSVRVGSLILALALSAVFLVRRAEVWFFLGLAIVGVTVACAIPPLPHLLHEVPLFDIAINERLAFAGAFAMAVLAGMAVDAWRRRASLVLVAVGAALAFAMLSVDVPRQPVAELVPLLLLVLVPPRIFAIVALGLVLLQRSAEDGAIYPAVPRSAFYPSVPAIERVARSEGLFRVAGTGVSLVPNIATMYGLEDVRGYNALTFGRMAETWPIWSRPQGSWFSAVDDPAHPFLSLMNVRYVFDGKNVIENPSALSRAFVPRSVRYERDGKAVLEGLRRATDFGAQAWIETSLYDPHDAPNGPGTVTIRRDGLAYTLVADMQQAGWIIVSETAWSGWRAYVGGRRVSTHFANHAFLGLHVPPGRHRIRLVYLPESFTRGRWISAGTLLGCLVLLFLRRLRRSERPL
jgi:Bacterial membrane protein YfhO